MLSKILERHVHIALYDFLNRHGLLFIHQSGFRPFHSCDTALIELRDTLLLNLDKGLISGLSLIDFRKAFDLVDHDILLEKLAMYNISHFSLQWFSSYLRDRTQKVVIEGKLSDPLPVTSGVPQGSILGPLLFIIFVNDLPIHTGNPDAMHIYADDTTQVAAGKTVTDVAVDLEQDLSKIDHWATVNRMALNTDKTKTMLICSRPKSKVIEENNEQLRVRVNNKNIESVNTTKLLGIYLDRNLTWNDHVDVTSRKINKRLGLLKRSKGFISCQVRLTFFNAIVQPVMDYGACIWGDSSEAHADTMLRLQKRAARIIADAPWDAPSEALFKDLGIVPFKQRVSRAKAALAFKAVKGMLPVYIARKFTPFSQVHSHNTRNSHRHLILPKVNLSFGRRTFFFTGSKLWNSLDQDLQNCSSLSSFIRKQSHFL